MDVFLIEDDDLRDSEPVYNKTFLKTKIKSHGDEVKIFTIKKFLYWTLVILFSINQLGFCSQKIRKL